MSVNLHLATHERIAAILAMMADFYAIDAYPFHSENTRKKLLYFLENEHLGRAWIVQKENTIVGYPILTFSFSFEYQGRDAFIAELFIQAPFRGQGIGKQAMALLEEKAKTLEVNVLHLEVEPHNEKGRQRYTQQGYRSNGRILPSKRLGKDL